MVRQLGMLLIEPRRPSEGSADLGMTKSACAALRQLHRPCAVVATSVGEANAFARQTNADYVVVQLASPTELARLTAGSNRRQVIAVLTVGTTPRLDATWDHAIEALAGTKKSAIAAGLSGSYAAVAIQDYFNLLQRHNVTAQTFDANRGTANGLDRLPPTTPLGGSVTNATSTSVDLSWIASTDNVGVTGYEVYVNGSLVGSTGATAFTVRGLSCGTSYSFAVDAYDKRKNKSTRLVFTGSTGACLAPSPAPQPGPTTTDTTPPSQPSGLTTTGVTTASMTVDWGPSTDNVGVSGYDVYENGVIAGSTSSDSYLLAGLSCGSSYKLSVKAYDAAGNRSQAASLNAATSSCSAPADTQPPSVPGSFHVTGTTVDSISVGWSPSTDNVGVTGYGIFQDGTAAGSTNSTSYTISGLACGSVHLLELDAYDAAGNHSARATLTTSTSACPPAADTTPPSTPTNVHAVGATPTSISIAWSPSTDGVGVTGYSVYNGSAPAGTTTSSSYTVAGLMCGATYSLAVDAFDAAGNHSSKAAVNVPTNACAPAPPAADTQPPTAPAGLQVLSATASSITLAWLASTDNVGVTGYGLYRGGTSTGTTTATTTTFSGLACGTNYALSVDAYDAAGNHSTQTTVGWSTSACPPAADTQAPTAPTGLQVTGATTTSITVSWNASTDNVAVTGYGLYRGGTSTGTTTATSTTFSGLTCGTTYTLSVDAYDAAGNHSSQATVSSPTSACPPPPPAPDTQAPTTPGSFKSTGATTTSITVGWTASTDNVGVAGYGLYRNGVSTGTSSSTSASFTGLACGTSYTLAVDAFDAAGNRSAKATVTASTSACPPPADTQAPTAPAGLSATAATTTSITVGWTASTDNVGVTGYGLYRNGTSTGSSSSTSGSFTGLTCGTAYTLAVDAYDAAGNRSAQASITASTSACPPPADTQAPTVPSGLHVTGSTATSVTLGWTASTDNVGVTGYRLYQGASQVGTATSATGTFNGLACGTAYTLGVAAVDGAGNVSGTATISANTPACATTGTSSNVSLAQNSTGTGDGSSCANAKPPSFFNTATNWGAGKPIAPGVTVSLCGTITSTLTAQGSGASGSPITILFTSGAKISQPVCSPCLSLDGKSFITVDGGSNGVIESNANGTNLANHAGSTGISAGPCDNCEIKNLTIQNIYVIASGDHYICPGGCAVDNAGAKCIKFSGHDWRIHDNVMHDASWCLYEYANGQDANNRIYNNNIYNFDHGWIVTGGGPYGNLYFYGNHVHDMGIWDNCNTNGSNCHHDGIHCFFGGNGTHFSGTYIYNNRWDGTVGDATTSWIFLEPNAGSACADSTSKWYLFNNVFSSSDEVPTNPYVGSAGTYVTPTYMYNNTFAGPGAGHYGNNGAACVWAAKEFENNAVGGCSRLIDTAASPNDNNAYAENTGGNCFPVGGCTFASWQATGRDTHGVFNGSVATGSNVSGVGANLSALCTGDLSPLCSDINGSTRPASGPWNAGATG